LIEEEHLFVARESGDVVCGGRKLLGRWLADLKVDVDARARAAVSRVEDVDVACVREEDVGNVPLKVLLSETREQLVDPHDGACGRSLAEGDGEHGKDDPARDHLFVFLSNVLGVLLWGCVKQNVDLVFDRLGLDPSLCTSRGTSPGSIW